MTTGEWVAYTGSDEQIAEMLKAKHGIVFKYESGREVLNFDFNGSTRFISPLPTHYWIIPDDPLREMKIRQAMTGQPVWIKTDDCGIDVDQCRGKLMGRSTETHMVFVTSSPDWNIPNAEYSFTAFEE